MSRNQPAHIVALDHAVEAGMKRLADAEAELIRVLDEHIVAYTTAKNAIDAAVRVRTDAFHEVRQCREAIKKLGYCEVVKVPDDLTINPQADMAAARERAGISEASA